MQKRKWGRIINVLNTGAKATAPAGYPTAVSRAAGMSLMKGLAGEFAKDNILVNGLLVGRIESDQWLKRWEASNKEKSYDEFLLDMAKTQKLPMGRLGTAEEFANMAAFLCTTPGRISRAARSTSTAGCARWCRRGYEVGTVAKGRVRKGAAFCRFEADSRGCQHKAWHDAL